MASSSDSVLVSSVGPPSPPSPLTTVPTKQRVVNVLSKPSFLKVAQKRAFIDRVCNLSNLALVFYSDPILNRARSLLSFRHQPVAARIRIMDGKFCASLLYDIAGLLEESASIKSKFRSSSRSADEVVMAPDIVREILRVV